MIPNTTVNMDWVKKNYKTKRDQNKVLKFLGSPQYLTGSNFPVWCCDDTWAEMGAFNGVKSVYHSPDFYKYGYADTEESLAKYLKDTFGDENPDKYIVFVGLLDMNYEKYYKFGSYINVAGVNTGTDYYPYIDEHPEAKVKQDYKGHWITFTVRRIKDDDSTGTV